MFICTKHTANIFHPSKLKCSNERTFYLTFPIPDYDKTFQLEKQPTVDKQSAHIFQLGQNISDTFSSVDKIFHTYFPAWTNISDKFSSLDKHFRQIFQPGQTFHTHFPVWSNDPTLDKTSETNFEPRQKIPHTFSSLNKHTIYCIFHPSQNITRKRKHILYGIQIQVQSKRPKYLPD